jgi:hypothetical protein
MPTVRELEEQLREARAKEAEEKRRLEEAESRKHVYPEKFPFHVDDVDEVTFGWFAYSEAYGDDGFPIWDDHKEAERRWELVPFLTGSKGQYCNCHICRSHRDNPQP